MPAGVSLKARIAGLAAAVPVWRSSPDEDRALFGGDLERVTASTGVQQRRVARDRLCTSDLCTSAAEALLNELRWERSSIQGLIVVTQTPDYALPATACVVHSRLGLGKGCAAFDVGLGCSGYVYGLLLAAQMAATGTAERVMLLVGDTITRHVSPQDRATALLFGDAGTATAIERSERAIHFEFGTDGKGARHLIVEGSGCRRPRPGASRHLHMNGDEVFSFTLREVPGLLESVLKRSGRGREEIDSWVFHQANAFMVKHLAKKCRLPIANVPLNLERFGNTSSASIPLCLVTELGEKLRISGQNVILTGFGVGLSWAALATEIGPIPIPPLVEVGAEAAENDADE